MQSFVNALNQQILAKAQLTQTLTKHPVLIGASREDAIKELIQPFIPARFKVLSGSVAAEKSQAQFDIMVADTDSLPVLLHSQAYSIVLPAAVKVIIEVKSNLARATQVDPPHKENDGETMLTVLRQIGRRRITTDLKSEAFSALVSFGAPQRNAKLREWLADIVRIRTEAANTVASSLRNRSPDVFEAQSRVQELQNSCLPDLILSTKGSIALKSGPPQAMSYKFLKTKPNHPALTVLVEQVVKTISGQISRSSDRRAVSAYQDILTSIGDATGDDTSVQPLNL